MCFALSTGAADGTLPGILDRGLPKPQVPQPSLQRYGNGLRDRSHNYIRIFSRLSPHRASIAKYQGLFIVLSFMAVSRKEVNVNVCMTT